MKVVQPQPKNQGARRRGEITLRILEIIGEMALLPIEIIWAMGAAGYGASMKDLEREVEKFRTGESFNAGGDSRTRQKYRNLIHKLKKEGFVAEKEKRGKRVLVRTKIGVEKLSRLKKLIGDRPFVSNDYKQEKTGKTIIFVFDVPEKERWKREWLRSVLRNLGLESVQKSVFVGKAKIPEQFLEDMKKNRTLDYVEIFEIGKTGTLKHVI